MRRPDLLPVLVLMAILAVLLGGWWLFPRVAAMISAQDCIAAGRADCSRY